ncbi:MAG: hypothetical protein RBT41_06935 [Clostridia bacterium]|nr:hypothetical protein [Clostridia bacterium]
MPVASYKCPNCGGPLQFKPELQKSRCDYCLSTFTDQELDEINQAMEEKAARESRLRGYICDSCGAEVVTEETTAAAFCYYCHSPVLLTGRLTGQFRPDKIIPFTYDRDKAVKSFLAWSKSRRYVPREFYSDSQLEKITGIYIPYWRADLKTELNYAGKGVNRRIWRVGDREYTETKEYTIQRRGSIGIDHLQEVATTKIDKGLLDSVAAYDEEKEVDFSLSYLSGFFAEKYNLEKDAVEPRIEERARKYASLLVKETIEGYQSVSLDKTELDISVREWKYTLLPVWILTYKYRNKTYIYAVNGQNGKSYGELPVDSKKLGLTSGLISALLFAVALLGGSFLW